MKVIASNAAVIVMNAIAQIHVKLVRQGLFWNNSNAFKAATQVNFQIKELVNIVHKDALNAHHWIRV